MSATSSVILVSVGVTALLVAVLSGFVQSIPAWPKLLLGGLALGVLAVGTVGLLAAGNGVS